jgi:hypothetical protein
VSAQCLHVGLCERAADNFLFLGHSRFHVGPSAACSMRRRYDTKLPAFAGHNRAMNEGFPEQRARLIRDLADTADPFIKQRLLDLTRRYERTKRVPLSAVPHPLANLPSESNEYKRR